MEQLLMDVTSLSSKGQLVLPKTIRKSLCLSGGDKFMIFVEGDNILLKPIKSPSRREFLSLINKAEKWADEVGIKKPDINKAIKAVRKKK